MEKDHFKKFMLDPAAELNISDGDFDALMSKSLGETPERQAREELEPGDPVVGIVIAVDEGAVLVELDSKSHGSIERVEFGDEVPAIGDEIPAHFVRFDQERELAELSVKEARRDLLWEKVRVGDIFEGVVAGENKGGLTLDIRGERAFMPISQIELSRVDDLSQYLGNKFECEVISFDRSSHDLVVSRRAILARQQEEGRLEAAAHHHIGEILTGRIVRINEHGAFIDLGASEGLLHASKIHRHQRDRGDDAPLSEGDSVSVEIVHIDASRGRIGLDLHDGGTDRWLRAAEAYQVGDEVTGLVSRVSPEGAAILLEDGIEGLIPTRFLESLPSPPVKGALVRTVVSAVDAGRSQIELKPS